MQLPNDYQNFIHLSRYSRYRDDLGRRETWDETVDRYMKHVVGDKATTEEVEVLRNAISKLDVMPSMRGLMTAGPALDRDHTAIFNCSYLPVDHPRAFDEAMYILLCGTGVGYSVERQFTCKLPDVPELGNSDTTIVVKDSKIGWAEAFRELIGMLYSGSIPKWDVSRVRARGARLKTFGGRASGPEPLVRLFEFTVQTFHKAQGRKLSSLECHDIMCKVGEAVVVGGVRRSAMISLSNLSDDRIRHAKSGQWWVDNPQRSLANNSVCYTEKPEFDSFMREWLSLYESRSGERGAFNRVAAKKQAASNGRRDPNHEFGTNPCSEIILRPYQFCNLSEVVVRPSDTIDDLKRKVELATILGTIQATFTNFRYLRSVWRKNTEEEALLGVSLTGVMDHWVLSGTDTKAKEWLTVLKKIAVDTNKEWAARLGINQSTAITCVKPSGTVSQLVDSASGLHPRYSSYYIRRVRNDSKDPLSDFMIKQGIPYEKDVMTDGQLVFSFPIKSPATSYTRNEVDALQQLEHWKMMQEYWCEHKPSITVYYRDDEFLDVGSWVWKNFDMMSGVSFLPHSEHTYQQAPYEEIDEAKYEELVSKMPTGIDWSQLPSESDDHTVGTQTLACTGNTCELI